MHRISSCCSPYAWEYTFSGCHRMLSPQALGNQPQLLHWGQCVASIIVQHCLTQMGQNGSLCGKSKKPYVRHRLPLLQTTFLYPSLNPETCDYLLFSLPLSFFRIKFSQSHYSFSSWKHLLIKTSNKKRIRMWHHWEMWIVCPWPPAKPLFGCCWLSTGFPGVYWSLNSQFSPKYTNLKKVINTYQQKLCQPGSHWNPDVFLPIWGEYCYRPLWLS